jgi:hypothetical protein
VLVRRIIEVKTKCNEQYGRISEKPNEGYQDFQKISAGVSLFILALGFSSIGFMSLIRQPLSGDSVANGAMSCHIRGWASLAVASVFLFVAHLYLRRHSRLAA